MAMPVVEHHRSNGTLDQISELMTAIPELVRLRALRPFRQPPPRRLPSRVEEAHEGLSRYRRNSWMRRATSSRWWTSRAI